MRGPDEQTERHVQLPVAGAAGPAGPSVAGDSPDDRRRASRRCRRASRRCTRTSAGRRFRPSSCCARCCCRSLYTVRSERLLMEEIDYSVLFRWFVGLSMDDPIWSPTTFSKNRDRLLQATSPARSSTPCVDQARDGRPAVRRALHGRRHAARGVGESEELSAQGRRPARRRPTIPGNPTVNFHGETAAERHASVDDRSRRAARIGRARARKRSWRISGTCCSTIATGWWRMSVPRPRPGPANARRRC